MYKYVYINTSVFLNLNLWNQFIKNRFIKNLYTQARKPNLQTGKRKMNQATTVKSKNWLEAQKGRQEVRRGRVKPARLHSSVFKEVCCTGEVILYTKHVHLDQK